MPIYDSDRTGASIDQVLDLSDSLLTPVVGSNVWNDNGTGITASEAATIVQNADNSNVGKSPTTLNNMDDTLSNAVVFNQASFQATNKPPAGNYAGVLQIPIGLTDWSTQIGSGTTNTPSIFARNKAGGAWSDWEKLYHTGNTGGLSFLTGALPTNIDYVNIDGQGEGFISTCRPSTSDFSHHDFYNPNGLVGTIKTNDTTTSFNTSSDPRLKTEFEKFDNKKAWNAFDAILSASGTFAFKSDLDKEVWGFNAHKLIDTGLDIGSEGEGPRDLNLNDVYEKEVIPAKFEKQPVMETVVIVGEDGQEQEIQREKTDSEGNFILEDVEVEAEKVIEKRVSPAGVDQSKVVPFLVAVIDDLRTRLEALENK